MLPLSVASQKKSIVVEKVYTGVVSGNTMVIYHRICEDAPYHVRIFKADSSEPRQLYVLKLSSAVFSYLLVEKLPDRLLYYPLVWSDLDAVTLKDVRERSEEVLKGLVKPVPKSEL